MRWVAAISLAGMLVCVGLSLVPVHSMPLIIALLVGIFVSFIPAVVGHPATKMRGTHASVSGLDVARSAPLWLNVVVGAVLAYFAVLCLTTSAFAGGDSFGISDAELRGHPERTRFLAGFFMVFYAVSAQIAVSAMRWWTKWASGALP